MTRIFYITGLLCLVISIPTFAQLDLLKQKIEQIISSKKADVGVSISGIERNDTLSMNGKKHYPMLSVFKFHIALTVLDKVDKGEFSLTQEIFIKDSELLPNTWSPFRDKYPNGNIAVTLKEVLQWTVSYSDNNLCDVLLNRIGGTKTVQDYMNGIGIKDFVILNDEAAINASWDAQFLNTTTPIATTDLLKKFYNEKILSKTSTSFLYKIMVETLPGPNRIKGKLPPDTEVAHRPGTSSTNDKGLTGAINNIGIITLPNGKHFAVAVYVSNTTEKFETGEQIIADIAKATWDYYANNPK